MSSTKKFLSLPLSVTWMFFCFALWGALDTGALAEVKIFNYTGQELKIDLETPTGAVRDITIPKENGLSSVIGPATPRGEMERLVLRSAAGKQLDLPCPVYSQQVVLLVPRGAEIGVRRAGFYNGPAEGTYIRVINATGQELQYAYTDHDSQLQKGKVENDFPDFNDWNFAMSAYNKPGQQMKVKFGIGQPATGEEQLLTIGGVYLATLVEGKLKMTKLGVD